MTFEAKPADHGIAQEHVPSAWERIALHTHTLDRAIRITQMADAKVAPVLALHVSLAAITVTQATALGALLQAGSHAFSLAALAWVCLIVYVATSLIASYFVVVVYVPTAPKRGAARTHLNSLFYFDDIQAMSVDEFDERSRHIDVAVAERDVIRQAHTVSRIASDKLVGVQQAYLFSALTLVAWMLLIVLSRV